MLLNFFFNIDMTSSWYGIVFFIQLLQSGRSLCLTSVGWEGLCFYSIDARRPVGIVTAERYLVILLWEDDEGASSSFFFSFDKTFCRHHVNQNTFVMCIT